jgi:hypothetical protein
MFYVMSLNIFFSKYRQAGFFEKFVHFLAEPQKALTEFCMK